MANLPPIRLLRGIPAEDAAVLLAACSERILVAGEELFAEGDVGGSIWIVKSGEAEAYTKLHGGVEQVLDTLGPGDSIGEVTFVEPSTRSASVRTSESSEFLVLTPEAFAKVEAERPGIAASFYANIARMVAMRLRNTTENYRDVMDSHLELVGGARLNLRNLSEDLRSVIVALSNGTTVEGRLLLVDHHQAGYALIVKSLDGTMKMIPYHAITWIQPLA